MSVNRFVLPTPLRPLLYYHLPYARFQRHTLTFGGPAGPEPEPPDETPPEVFGFVPLSGTTITKNTEVALSVTDDVQLGRVMLFAHYISHGVLEVVHDGDAFGPAYDGARDDIEGGYEFSDVVRKGGWPSSPKLIVYAVDAAGNEADMSETFAFWPLEAGDPLPTPPDEGFLATGELFDDKEPAPGRNRPMWLQDKHLLLASEVNALRDAVLALRDSALSSASRIGAIESAIGEGGD
jgi:hypothetical protein